MSGFIGAMTLIGAVIFPFVMMPLLWRRMKRVRDQAYGDAAPPQHAAT